MSNGGQFFPAIVIGDFIRLTGMATYVPADKTCASACAFVWLAGAQRMVGGGTKAHIGFHGVYDAATGQQLVVPNVILATYLGYLNFTYDAVLWMLTPRPLATHWLTAKLRANMAFSLKCSIRRARWRCRRARSSDSSNL